MSGTLRAQGGGGRWAGPGAGRAPPRERRGLQAAAPCPSENLMREEQGVPPPPLAATCDPASAGWLAGESLATYAVGTSVTLADRQALGLGAVTPSLAGCGTSPPAPGSAVLSRGPRVPQSPLPQTCFPRCGLRQG